MPRMNANHFFQQQIANQLRLIEDAKQLERIYPGEPFYIAEMRLQWAQMLPPKSWTEGWREPQSEWTKIP